MYENLSAVDAVGYYPGKAKSLNANINSYIGLGEREKALRSANKLYEIASSEGDDYYMGQALMAQALSYAYLVIPKNKYNDLIFNILLSNFA